ncbi:uncharacterized protein UTRI_04850 [Ustilago trichophora]|uniref:Uncharacterized protein n=1 Tax=Ustilago trichophora TaxID=86804 RepID=A0A5C3ECQ4_9BASI|nr:uncharacterized protein UTRI_04850 [Ustilago trichophora]
MARVAPDHKLDSELDPEKHHISNGTKQFSQASALLGLRSYGACIASFADTTLEPVMLPFPPIPLVRGCPFSSNIISG